MTTTRWLVLACATATLGAGGVLAQDTPTEMQGAALLASCQAREMQCGAYLQGVLDGLISQQKVCDPPRYNRDRLREVYVLWAEANSYFHDKHMLAGAELAMSEAWPCKQYGVCQCLILANRNFARNVRQCEGN